MKSSSVQMKFPSVEVNTINPTRLAFIFNRIFGEENAIESMDQLENGSVCIHFNQNLPMNPDIEKFYQSMKEMGEIKMNVRDY
jgi:hypothetical protein